MMLQRTTATIMLSELAVVLEVSKTNSDWERRVFDAAYDWYYVPRSKFWKDRHMRVLEYAWSEFQKTAELPTWIARVHNIHVLTYPVTEKNSIPWPPDPKDLPSP